jgi:uncharacterized membrane-anchored protein
MAQAYHRRRGGATALAWPGRLENLASVRGTRRDKTMKMAFAGSFAVRLAEPVQARLSLATLIAANIERTAGTKALLSAIDPHC